jgi:predicted esterase
MLEPNTFHKGQPILSAGKSLENATAAMLLLHGRGATAESILSLVDQIHRDEFVYLAPQAMNNTWYPHSFLAPIENNEPWLSSALSVLKTTVDKVEKSGIPGNRICIFGFSQGACLAMEFIARNPQSFGGAVALSGGLIGPPGIEFSYLGSLENTPVLLGCSDIDPHIPLNRVEETALVLQDLGADVTKKIYPGMGHMVNQDEIDQVRKIMDKILHP